MTVEMKIRINLVDERNLGEEQKPKKMSDDWSVLDHKALGTITLMLSSPVVLKITKNEGLQSIYPLTA